MQSRCAPSFKICNLAVSRAKLNKAQEFNQFSLRWDHKKRCISFVSSYRDEHKHVEWILQTRAQLWMYGLFELLDPISLKSVFHSGTTKAEEALGDSLPRQIPLMYQMRLATLSYMCLHHISLQATMMTITAYCHSLLLCGQWCNVPTMSHDGVT